MLSFFMVMLHDEEKSFFDVLPIMQLRETVTEKERNKEI